MGFMQLEASERHAPAFIRRHLSIADADRLFRALQSPHDAYVSRRFYLPNAIDRLRPNLDDRDTAIRKNDIAWFRWLNFCRWNLLSRVREARSSHFVPALARDIIVWSQRTDDATSRIVEANLGLTHTLAFRNANRGVDHEELCAEGAMFLLKAVRRFDPERGFKFSTYAWVAILTGLRRAIDCAVTYRDRFGETTFDASAEPDERFETIDAKDAIASLRGVADLSAREWMVVEMRYGLLNARCATLDEVATRCTVSRERARQIQDQAIGKLRDASESLATQSRFNDASPVVVASSRRPKRPAPAKRR